MKITLHGVETISDFSFTVSGQSNPALCALQCVKILKEKGFFSFDINETSFEEIADKIKPVEYIKNGIVIDSLRELSKLGYLGGFEILLCSKTNTLFAKVRQC